MALEAGSRLAHYDVIVLIGEGGMGQVYQATAKGGLAPGARRHGGKLLTLMSDE